MPGKIFISYRRDDAKAEARSIYQHIQRVYGRDGIFMDVDSIQKGLDFTKVLGKSLSETSVMLVVMGRTWLSQQDASGHRRLDDPADFVRLEIASALKRDIHVIPVRVDGARLPRVEELPDDIKGLVLRQGTAITHENFDSDLRGLEDDLRRIVDPGQPAASGKWPLIGTATAALVLAAGIGMWSLTRGPTLAPVPRSDAATTDLQVAATAALRQQDDDRQKKEGEVRRRVEEELSQEARKSAEATRLAAAEAARHQAQEDARRQLERTRLEAEAEALQRMHAEQEAKRKTEMAKADAIELAKKEAQRVRQAAMTVAWTQAVRANGLPGYLDYLRTYPDAPNKTEARERAAPLILQNVEDQIEARLLGRARADGTISLYERYPDNPRAAALCIDWRTSSASRMSFVSGGLSGNRNITSLAEREEQALGICQSGRREGATCTCEIVRRNHDRTTKIPADWLARQLD